jgi:hypothetical protein
MRALAILLLIFPFPAYCAQTYYVSPEGNDSGLGTWLEPFRTVQRAADLAVAGDSVLIRGGVYHEFLAVARSGAAGAPISFASFGDETVVLDGTGLEWKYGINIEGNDYLHFQGLAVRNYRREGTPGFGFVSWSHSRGIVLKDMEFSGVGTAVKFHAGGDDILLEDIVARDYAWGGFDCGPAGPGTNLTLRRFSAWGPGTGNDTGVDGFAVETGANVLVEDCLSIGHPGDGFDFKSDRTRLHRVISRGNARNNIKLWGRDSSVVNSLSADSGLAGLVLAEWGAYTVANCLFANSLSYGYLAECGYGGGATGAALYNNIFYNDRPEMGGTLVYVGPGVSLSAAGNLYFNPYRDDAVVCAAFLSPERCFSSEEINDGTWLSVSGRGEGDLYADPRFVDPAAFNYRYLPASLARDSAVAGFLPVDDLDGVSRPQRLGYDRGPYEYGADLNDDGCVDSRDLGILFSGWGGGGKADLDGNGTVGEGDLGLMVKQLEQ